MKHLKKYEEIDMSQYREVEPGVFRSKQSLQQEMDEKNMKQWVLTTTSESSDHYIYLIEHPNKPTEEELNKFLMTYGSDKDEDRTYEYVDSCVQITNFQRIPR